MPPPIDRDVVDKGADRHGRSRRPDPADLTPRQREVLRLIAEGCSTKEIGRRLHTSVKTVEFHRANIKRRLGFAGTAELTRFAVRTGIVDP